MSSHVTDHGQLALDRQIEEDAMDVSSMGEEATIPGPRSSVLLNHRAALARKLREAQQGVLSAGADSSRHAPSISPGKALQELTPHLNVAGLVLDFDLEELREEKIEAEKVNRSSGEVYSETWFKTTAVLRWTLTDVETGYSISRRMGGTSLNKDADGTVHAQRQAIKQSLLALLQVNVGRGETPPPQKRQNRPQGRESAPEGRDPRPRARKRSSGQETAETGVSVGSQGFDLRDNGEGKVWRCIATGRSFPRCGECGGVELPDGCVNSSCDEYRGDDADPLEVPAGEDPVDDDLRRYRALKEEYSRLSGELRPWQEEALVKAESDVRDDLSIWNEREYEVMVRKLRAKAKLPGNVKAAARHLAKEEPTADERIQKLRELMDDADLPVKDRAEIQEAIDTGWNSAVEEEIDRLVANLQLRGPGYGSEEASS